MARFNFSSTPLQGLTLVKRQLIEDSRGFLSRFYCADEFRVAGLKKPIAQINHTFTYAKGTVRGMHYQNKPYAEAKVVSCLHGEIFDVAVDLRHNSPTFLHWHGVILTAINRQSLIIPEGFAHGFQTLTEDCELVYLHTNVYNSESEAALNANDLKLNIDWPLDITDMSERDKNHPFIEEKFQGIAI